MEYLEIEKGKITHIISSMEEQKDAGFYPVDLNVFAGRVGDEKALFQSDWTYKSDEALVKEGLKKDIRGVYYNVETKERKKIESVWEELDETRWTKLEPEDGQSWDGTKWETPAKEAVTTDEAKDD